MSKINQYQLLKEKLSAYNKPFIDNSLVKKLLEKFAPNYQIKTLTTRGLLTPIIRWKLYQNLCYKWYVSDYAIIGKYMENKPYMIWGLFIYNQYWFTTQLADRITVYNCDHSWKRKIWTSHFIFKRVRPSFLWWKERKQSQNVKYYRMSKERALIELILGKKWKLEFWDDIKYEIENDVDMGKLYSLMKKLNKTKYALVDSYIQWLKK